MGERFIYFDHDYAPEIVKKLKEYNAILKNTLKEKGIRFQTPYTNMQFHWATGICAYSTAQGARRDLKNRGFPVNDLEPTEGENLAETRLLPLMGWQHTAGRQENERLRPRERGENSESTREDTPRIHEHVLKLH